VIKSVNISSEILNFRRDMSFKKSKKVYSIIAVIKLINISSEMFDFRFNIHHVIISLCE
jgi:hypothetical protein